MQNVGAYYMPTIACCTLAAISSSWFCAWINTCSKWGNSTQDTCYCTVKDICPGTPWRKASIFLKTKLPRCSHLPIASYYLVFICKHPRQHTPFWQKCFLESVQSVRTQNSWKFPVCHEQSTMSMDIRCWNLARKNNLERKLDPTPPPHACL